MKAFKKILSLLFIVTMITSLAACSNSSGSEKEESSSSDKSKENILSNYEQDNESLTIDNSAWKYDKENDVYYQIGVQYSSKPETTEYETMAIYVPGAYMTATANGDGTYTCKINKKGKVNGYTAETAPIVFPVNTAGYSAQKATTSYSYNGLSSYLDAGYIYVYAGLRGRNNGYDDSGNLTYSGGAPWGVTDLKAAVRYYRFNQSTLPGSTDHIFTFGHSGGGAQSALMGSTGDSELYYDYLTSIGAAMYDQNGEYISDAIYGAMAWCPVTSLDYANEAYEWNMGQYSNSDTRANDTWTSALSDDLAQEFASYINELGLKDEDGTVLNLKKTDNGIYTSGTYYNYILSVIEESLNNFLSDTTFPYTETSGGSMGDGGFAGGGGGMPTGEMPEGGMPSGEMPKGGAPSEESGESTTYKTAQDYIDSLNSDEEWIKYDKNTNTAKITSIEAFVTHIKKATKDVAAFDDLNLKQAETMLFGNDESDALHFDSVLANLLKKNKEEYSKYSDWDSSVVSSYANDLKALDKLGNSSEYRQNMYNPMYYLTDYYKGYKTSTVAPHWRIRTGIEQGDTALTVESNLALALENYEGVKDVDFTTVWGQGHTTAERTGDSTDNFIKWVNESIKSDN
ncbi:esterase (plasmid) [Bacillus sp. JZ8]